MARRRYRIYVVCAIVILFFFYRASQSSWESNFESSPLKPHTDKPAADNAPPAAVAPESKPKADDATERPQQPPAHDVEKPPVPDEKKPDPAKPPPVAQDRTGGGEAEGNKPAEDKPAEDKPAEDKLKGDDAAKNKPAVEDKAGNKGTDSTSDNDASGAVDTPKHSDGQQGNDHSSIPIDKLQDDAIELPNESPKNQKQNPMALGEAVGDVTEIHWQNPTQDQSGRPKMPADAQWRPVPENFPVPSQSLIHLPSGTPKQIPKIQFDFQPESEKAKATRLARLGKVKAELERSWDGYRKHAWMHDELRPLSAAFREKFGGWAATLVDSLDTLWIAGMKTEFDEAAKAAHKIDFTHSDRWDVQVFETTIRYLGGLISAFDVSGGHDGSYKMLLDKAVELAEILMGIFDTPNRMPLLYYNWRFDFASQPHLAGRVGMAELATLSMEFTRLAQMTGEHKYYDAVARITNELVKMQEVGTAIPGLFPESLDASGCNRSAATSAHNSVSVQAQQQFNQMTIPQGYKGKNTPQESNGDRASQQGERPAFTDDQLEVPEDPSVAKTAGSPNEGDTAKTTTHLRKRNDPPLTATGQTAPWNCEPQGLVPYNTQYQSFHMGGGQDSAYEYFPKEYLLLGGLEPKYEKLHVDTVKAINEWLMFRPMINDDWDILFPAKLHTRGNPDVDLTAEFEVTHLTCFIGGMFGLGGKIFGRDEDIETAKKLTNGCVWAYQMTPSGLMPENSKMVPCPTLEKCEFNATVWWDALDPFKESRNEKLAKWSQTHGDGLNSKQRPAGAEGRQEPETTGEDEVPDSNAGKDAGTLASNKALTEEKEEQARRLEETAKNYGRGTSADSSNAASSPSLRKRAAIPADNSPNKAHESETGSELPDSLKKKLGMEVGKTDQKVEPSDEKPQSGEKADSPEAVSAPQEQKAAVGGTPTTNDAAPPEEAQVPPPQQPLGNEIIEDIPEERPQTHEEFVNYKIQTLKLPPGFTEIPSSSYILRPEAIESVWYMYRITGDPTWMDKGWKMFEATVRATATQFANSAIDDVFSEEPVLRDEMESFWIAETLKYYCLLFSEPDVISLDEWVLNTEAHPFRRPTAAIGKEN